MSSTTNYSLGKPQRGMIGWDQTANDNFDKINLAQLDIRTKQAQAQVDLDSIVISPRLYGYNMGFDYWQNGDQFTLSATKVFTADQWEGDNVGSGSTVLTKVTGNNTNDFAFGVLLTFSNTESARLRNYIPYKAAYSDFYKFCRGKKVTFSCDLKKSSAVNAAKVYLEIDDGIGVTQGSPAAVNTLQRITIQRSIDSASTLLSVAIFVDTSNGGGTLQISNAAFAIGDFSSVDYIPKHPQDDYYGCAAVRQYIEIGAGWYGQDADVEWKYAFPYPCPMIDTPTATQQYSGLSVNGNATIKIVPVNTLGGYVHATGVSKTGRLADRTGAVWKLSVY